MNKDSFKYNAQQMGIALSDTQLHKFDIYQRELLTWNLKINLISEKSAQEIATRHFLDSLTALQFIDKQNARVLDIGSGAGFPGIPLKIALPTLKLYLMESNRKKVSFLKHIIRELYLEETFIVHNRAEHVIKNKNWQEIFDIVVSRAAFHLPEFISFSTFFLTANGKFIALKGNDVEAEFSQCVKKTTVTGLFELFQHDTITYTHDKKRKIIVGKKLKKDKNIF